MDKIRELEKELELAKAIDDYCNVMADELTAHPASTMPVDLKRKIERRVNHTVQRKSAFHHVWRIANVAALVLLLVIAITAVLCCTVAAIREPIVDFLMERTGYAAVEMPGGKIYAYEMGGYQYVGGTSENGVKSTTLRNEAGQEITIVQQPADAIGAIDTEDAQLTEPVTIMEGVDGLYIEKEDRDGQLLHILWWSNGDMAYCIMGTFPRDEIMRFAQGVGRQ